MNVRPFATAPTTAVDGPSRGARFRPDIEGLRAVAIVTVVLFHTGGAVVPGGFIGVDVFFVISGFLISGIILRELREARFSLASFYERRIRRIFPALTFMLIGSALLAYVLLPPLKAVEFGRTLTATTVFVSNMEFWRLSGYFDGPATLKPLLHTWSLAVEEQFYIVFPLLLIGLWRFCRSGLIAVVAACAAASFAASVWALAAGRSDAAFYLAPLRAYELLSGALLALGDWPPATNRRLREASAAVGLGLIASGAFAFTARTPFPGASALVPCLGACLIIHAGGGGSSLVAKGLSLAPIRFIGGISYSLYLWHWPLLVFARQLFFDEMSPAVTTIAVAAAVAMAVVSRIFVERPFLRRSPRGPRVFLPATAAMAGVATLGLAAIFSGGLPWRFPAESLRLFAYAHDFNPYRKECQAEDTNIISYEKTCRFGAPVPPTIAVWGDSLGAEVAMALGEAAGRHGTSVRQITWAGCAPSLHYETKERPACARHNLEVFDRLRRDLAITDVVIIAHYEVYSKWSVFMAGLEETERGLAAAGKRLTIMDPVPTLHFSAPEASGLLVFWGRPPGEMVLPREEFDRVHKRTLARLDTDIAALHARRIVPAELFCNRAICRSFADGAPLYFDQAHMSLTAARRLVDAAPAFAAMWVR